MAILKWSSTYSVGVEEIDRQHKELFDTINRCNSKIEEKDITAPKTMLLQLMEYALNHFKTEERYFASLHYPDAEGHRKKHETFEKKIDEFQMTYRTKGTFNAPLVHDFIKDWIINHILICDRKYKKWFAEHGMT